MFIVNKIGSEHIASNKNNQDFYMAREDEICVVDGCSEGSHSEVGAKLFCQLFQYNSDVNAVFKKLLSICPDKDNYKFVKDNLLFTILSAHIYEDSYIIGHCGDGYIITQDYDDNIQYIKLEDEFEFPRYYAYNYIDRDKLSTYKDGVEFDIAMFPMQWYKRIGLASDGIRYILDSVFKDDLSKAIIDNKPNRIARLINKDKTLETPMFKDDITICMLDVREVKR